MDASRLLSDISSPDNLRGALSDLLEQQRATWPMLRDGEAALAASDVRTLATGEAALIAQANLRRSTSTFARTDAASVAARPCFLCADNLPPEERGVRYGDLVFMPNPFPAVRDHLTIAARSHVPQRIAGRVRTMHEVSLALGDQQFVLYNGPRCGASAPDHFHLQCGQRESMPIFEHPQLASRDGLFVLRAGKRSAFAACHESVDEVTALVEASLAHIAHQQPDEDEPMVNVLTAWFNERHVTLVFPRTRHRPGDFFTAKNALAISPAALEMAGLVVVCDENQFQRLTAPDVEAIFDEVCVSASLLEDALRDDGD